MPREGGGERKEDILREHMKGGRKTKGTDTKPL